MQEFHCKVYEDYKISIPVKLRKLLSISPKDEIILKINDKNEMTFGTVQLELAAVQKGIQEFFSKKSIVDDFLSNRASEYDDN
ncbi:MAG: hypothetical protein ACK5Z5_03375 [Neisseriaceae bacterium]